MLLLVVPPVVVIFVFLVGQSMTERADVFSQKIHPDKRPRVLALWSLRR